MSPDKSIINPNYQEHPELDYTHQVQYRRNIDMFLKAKYVLYPPTRQIYEYVRNLCIDVARNHPQYPKWIWKPKICDVGCGGGFGSNILSQEADFVWGIDKDEESIKWAQTVFTRHKNNIYYSSQLTFEVIDVLDEPREIMPFDMVTCIETIEHINDYEKVLAFLKRLCKKDKRGQWVEPPESTMVFISSPNRNHPRAGQETPKSKRHVREWTPAELYGVLTQHFKYVTLMNYKGEPQELNTQTAVLLFKCEVPI